MRLVVAIALMLLGCAFAARYNNPYKNKRIIKVRVPPRQHTDFYNGPKGYLRPSTSPFRFKDFHYKHREFQRPSHQATYYSVSNIYSNHQVRPPPQAQPNFSFSGATFGKGYSKEIYHKFPSTYGSSYPHKKPLSTFKFPGLTDEVRITHAQAPSPSPAPAITASSSSQPSPSPAYQPTSFYVSSPHAHVQSFGDSRGPIREIPAPDLSPKPVDANEYTSYGKGPSIDVTNLVTDSGEQQLTFPATEYYSLFGQNHNVDVINDNHLPTTSVYTSDLYKDGAASSLQQSPETGLELGIASTPSPDITFKNNKVAATPVPPPSSGYEVTEEQHTSSGATLTNNQQFYYAPDPDPSLPVYKVPPTKEVLPEGKNLVETYIPQQNFQILEGGTVRAPITTLSTQQLFQLMHGFTGQVPVVAEPVVTILGHQQPGGLYIQPSYAYAQTGNEQYSSQSIGNGHTQQLVVPQQGTYVPQQHYQTAYAQSPSVQNYDSNDYQYEPEASESRETGNQMETNENSSADKAEDQLGNQIIIHFNKLPEVPFYSTLPNKEAAEALASLQAAGSIGSNYVNSVVVGSGEKTFNAVENTAYTQLRGDQGPEREEEGENEVADFGLSAQELVKPQKVEVEEAGAGVLSQVEIQKSVPVFETSYPATSLLDSTHATRSPASDVDTESFGKKIRPK